MKFWMSLLVFTSVACSQNSDSNSNLPGAGGGNNSAAAVPELVGTWSKPCAASPTGSSKNSFIIDAAQVQMLNTVYQANNQCSGTSDLESRSNFSYSVENYLPGQVTSMNLVFRQALVRMNTPQGIAIANTTNFCGFKDWQLSIDKDVTGRNCLADLPAAGEPYYQIFRATGPELFIGMVDTQHTGRAPESRPTELESTAYAK